MPRSDHARLEDILRRTLMGLEDDLDDLRDELGQSLVSYEGRIDTASAGLPNWLAFPAADIRKQFSFTHDDLGSGRLGPRAVALGAARVEALIHRWLGQGDELAELVEDQSEMLADFEDVDQVLEQIESLARELAMDADTQLGNWLDDIIAELDERREQDSAALRELVGSGDLEKGNQARAEIAEIWEDQRMKASELRRAWEVIEQLVFEGVDLTVAGIQELRSLRRRAYQGLITQVSEAEEDEPEGDSASLEIDHIPDTEITGLGADSSTPRLRIPQGERTTSKMDVPGEPTQPYLPAMEDSEASEVEETVDPEIDDTSGLVTAKMDIVGPPISEPDDVDELDEPDEPDEPEAEELAEQPEGAQEDDEDVSVLPTLTDIAEPKETEPAQPKHEDRVTYTSTAIRVVDGWSPVRGKELVIVLGVPGAFLLGLVLLTLLKLMGGPEAFDPYEAWPLVFPWGFISALGWIVIGILLRHWRPVFSPSGAQLVAWVERQEEEDVVVGEEVLRMGNLRYPWANMKIELRRWESRPDGTFGWYLSLQPRGASHIELVAPERNFAQWDTSNVPVVEPPLDIWQISPVLMQKIRDACE